MATAQSALVLSAAMVLSPARQMAEESKLVTTQGWLSASRRRRAMAVMIGPMMALASVLVQVLAAPLVAG